MHIVSELFVAREAAARRYLGAWDEEAALEGQDDWFDEGGAEDASAPLDALPDESAEPPSPLDEAREALVALDHRGDLDAKHVAALWDVLERPAPGARGARGTHSLERVTRHGTRTLFRLPDGLLDVLAAVQNADVDTIVRQWTGEGGFQTTTTHAATILRSLRELSAKARAPGLGLYLLVLA